MHGGGGARAARPGVKSVQLVEGAAVWEAGEQGRWSKEMLRSALSRSDNLKGFSVTDGRPQDMVGAGVLPGLVKDPWGYFIEYRDGLKATLLMLSDAVGDFTFAARVKGEGGDSVHAVFADAGSECDVFAPVWRGRLRRWWKRELRLIRWSGLCW